MRDYLMRFFSEFSYEEKDAAFLLSAYDRIAADAETKALWEEAILCYKKDACCDFDRVLALADEVAEKLYLNVYTTELLIFICLSEQAKRYYREKGLSEEIYRNTMLDLRYKLEECKLVKGVIGSFVAIWFVGFFQFRRFALGRLQFELTNFDGYYEKDGKKLTPQSRVIDVHIPRSLAPLTEESCHDAYRQAQKFFEKETGANPAFVCHSWLLYPENETILSKDSNTYRFMSRFDVVASGTYRDDEDLWRLFDTDERNPDRLPKNTSMRRAYAEHLKKGGKTGWGYGVFFL